MMASDVTPKTDTPTLNVLLVESDPVQRRDHPDCLKGWGYNVVAAGADSGDSNSFDSLHQNAIQK